MTRHARLIGLLAVLLTLGVAVPAMGATDAPASRAGGIERADLATDPADEAIAPAAVCALKAYSDYALIDVIAPVVIDVLANDCLGDARPDRPLTVTAVTKGTYGAVTTDGRSVFYDPTGCTLGDGGWDTFGYTISDGTGTSSGIVAVQFRRPTANPVTDLPQAGFVTGSTMGTTVPVKLGWCGVTASGSSVKSYRVIQSTNGGTSYSSTPIVTGTATASTRSLAVNTSYRWQARTTDSKGRTGTYAPSLTSRITRYQESSTAIRYSSGWKTASSSRYSGGKERYVQKAGATATLTVTNVRQFAIVASRASGRGSFHVYVDGVRRATVSQRSSTASWRRVLYVGGLTSGPGVSHTIQVRSATSARIDLDTILTLSGKQDQTVSFTTPTPTDAAYLGSEGAPTVAASSGLPVSLSLPAASWPVCSLDDATLSFHGTGTCTVAATAASDQTWNPRTASLSFAVGPAPVTVTGISALDRPYAPGDTGATLDTTGAELMGVAVSDAAGVSLDVSAATGAFADAHAGPGKAVQVAGLALTGAKAGLYTVVQPTITATITKADQEVAFDTAEPAAVKDGPAYTVAATSTSGLPVTITVAAGSAGVCAIDGATVTFPGSGTCDLVADQAGDGDWNEAATAIQSFSVASTGTEPQAITFAQPANVTYGTAPVALTASSSSSLTVSFTSLTPAVCSTSGSTAVVLAAGTCTIEAGQPGDPVYAPALDVPRSFSVAPKALTVTGVTAANKVYDGLTTASLATGSAALQGVVGVDAVTLVTSGAAGTFTPDANVGAGKTVTIAGLALSGSKAGSYTLVQPVATASITKATLVVTPEGRSIVYGQADPTFGFAYAGFVAGETAAVIGTAPTCGVAGASRDVAGSPYPITCAGGLDDNYQFDLSATAALTVSPKPVSASFTAAGRAYDGTTSAAITGCSLVGLEAADTGLATCSSAGATATFASADVGIAIVVTGSGFTVTGTKGGNYTVTATNPTTATITEADAACTVNAYGVVYDGLPHTSAGQCLGVGGASLAGLDLSGTTHTDAGTYAADAWLFTDVTGNYLDEGGTVANAIAQAPQAITFTSTAPAPGYVGGTYQVTTTSTGSGEPVVVSIASASTAVCSIDATDLVTFVAAGTCTIEASKAVNTNYLEGFASQVVTVSLVPQTITFDPPATKTYGEAPFAVSATSTSALPVTISTQTPAVCTVSDTTVTILHAGTCTLRAEQAGTTMYAPATLDRTITVAKADQTITFTSTAPTDAAVGDTYTPTATSTSGLTVVFGAGPGSRCTISGGVVTFLAASPPNCTITASQAGDGDHNAATNATQAITIRLAQALTFDPPTDKTYGDAPFAVTATASSNLTVTVASLTPAVCSTGGTNGTTITILAAGTCDLRATQAGNASYAPETLDRTIAVAKATLTVTADGKTITYGQPDPEFTFAYGTFVSGDGPLDLATPPTCGVSGPHADAGTYPITCSGGADEDYAFAYTDGTLTVAEADQVITFTSAAPAGATVGGSYVPAATATSPLEVVLTIDASATSVCSLAAGTVHFDAVGTCVVNANQAGDGNWNPAPQAPQSFAVGKATQAITFDPLADRTYGDEPFTVAATGGASGNPVIFDSQTSAVCTTTGTNGTTVTILAAGSCTVRASQAGTADYLAAPDVDRTFTVAPRAITVTAVTDSKTADGTTSSTGVPLLTAGSLASGDAATWTQSFDTGAAGTGKTLTPAGMILHGDTDVTSSYAITFVAVTDGAITPAAASLADSTVSAAPASIPADGLATSTITVQLIDAFGNSLATSGGAVTLGATAGSLGAVTDNGDGTYTATYTSDTTPGAVTITATLDGQALVDDATVTQTAP